MGTSLEKFRVQSVSPKNFTFSPISVHGRRKKVSNRCALNFDANDLPYSPFEPSYPQDFRGTTEVDLVSRVWRPQSGNPNSCTQKKGHFEVFLF